jgi:hypothetical protein
MPVFLTCYYYQPDNGNVGKHLNGWIAPSTGFNQKANNQ